MAKRTVQQESQATAGVCIRPGIVGTFEQLSTIGNSSQSSCDPTPYRCQAGLAIARGGDVSPSATIARKEIAINLRSDQTDFGVWNRLGKKRGNSQRRLTQPFCEAE